MSKMDNSPFLREQLKQDFAQLAEEFCHLTAEVAAGEIGQFGQWQQRVSRSLKEIQRQARIREEVLANPCEAVATYGRFAVDLLASDLASPDADWRRQAARGLWDLRGAASPARAALAAALADPVDEVRFLAVQALASMGVLKEEIPAVVGALSDSTIGPIAQSILYRMRARNLIPVIAPLVTGGSGSVRANAIKFLGHLQWEASTQVPALIDCLRDKDPTIQAASAAALGNIGLCGESVVPALIPLLKGSPGTVIAAAKALWHFPEHAAPAVPELVSLVKSGPQKLSKVAAQTLARLGRSNPEIAVSLRK